MPLRIYTAGGDGTFMEAMTGVQGIPGAAVGCLPYGSGNDFLTDIGGKAGDAPRRIDQYLTELPSVYVNGMHRYFLNGIGYGIDGYCCEEADKIRESDSTAKINYTGIAIKGLLFFFKKKKAVLKVDGKEYFFVDLDRFREMVENDELLEHAEYVANSYGTPRAYVERMLNDGMDVILDIEVQGARQVNEKMSDAVKVFIIPPSLDELKRRLESRGTDTARAVEARLIRARQEYREADFYDYIIVNDDADIAAAELSAIMTAERCRAAGRERLLTNPV